MSDGHTPAPEPEATEKYAILKRRGVGAVTLILLQDQGTCEDHVVLRLSSRPQIHRGFAEAWLRQKEAEAEELRAAKEVASARRDRLNIATAACAAFLAGGAWLFPQAPSKPKLKPDFVYGSGHALTRLDSSQVSFLGSIALIFYINPNLIIRIGQVLSYNDTICIVTSVMLHGSRGDLVNNEIVCQLIPG